jgi:hypothetical protein
MSRSKHLDVRSLNPVAVTPCVFIDDLLAFHSKTSLWQMQGNKAFLAGKVIC